MSRRGDTLMEVLVALFILALFLPSLFSALGGCLLGAIRIEGADARRYGTDWWFNRLGSTVNVASLASMPRDLPGGGVSFVWSSRVGSHGEVWVTLEVRSGTLDSPLVTVRAF